MFLHLTQETILQPNQEITAIILNQETIVTILKTEPIPLHKDRAIHLATVRTEAAVILEEEAECLVAEALEEWAEEEDKNVKQEN